jgi:hypothetical protein
MKKHLLPLIGLTLLTACHVGTYKKEICTDKNVVELINLEGEYKRIYNDSEKLADIIKGSHGKGSYTLREYRDNNVNSSSTIRYITTCKVGEKLIAEFKDASQRVFYETDTTTYTTIEIKDNELVLSGINRKDMQIPSIDNREMTPEETMTHFMPKDEYYKITLRAAETSFAKARKPKILISE